MFSKEVKGWRQGMSKMGDLIKEWSKQPLGKLVAGKVSRWWNKPLEYPWPEQLTQEVQQSDSMAVCPHCFTPQEHAGWFCPECGTSTGPYNNILPYIYIFSIGEGARAGVGKRFKWSPFNTFFLILFGVMEYQIFAPLYWFRMYRNWYRQKRTKSPHSDD